ncbi:MAG: hypothetical protein HYY08_02215 [Firmicutes bacterium]|nr:hypothetical protein [Bacillota bacterium]
MSDVNSTADSAGNGVGSMDKAAVVHARAGVGKNKVNGQGLPEPSSEDRRLLRRFAERVREIASLPEQKAKRERWLAHNSLKKGAPIILCVPEGAWRELVPAHTLVTSDPVLRDWEYRLRQTAYRHEHIHDDEPIEAFFDIGWVSSFSGWGLKQEEIRTDQLGAARWDHPVKELKDIEKLRFPETVIDEERTRALVALADDIFGDLLEVRIKGMFWWSLGLTDTAMMLRGLERVMLDVYDNPGWLHEFVAFLRDGMMHMLESLEAGGWLTLNNGGNYICSGGVGLTDELPAAGYEPGHVRLRDMWGFAESQEFVGVSPRVFKEFAHDYQLPLLGKFGLNGYGCCEPVHHWLDAILRTPNLRRISVSPWADLKVCSQAFGDRYIFSYKPHPGVLAGEHLNEEAIRAPLENAMRIARGCRLEIIMKDTHTVRNDPWRIERWTQIAGEVRDAL